MENADDIVKALGAALMLAYVAAFGWTALWRKGIAPIVALNFLTSVAVVAYWVPRIPELCDDIGRVPAFVGFELAVLASSLLALCRFRVPRPLIWIEFAVNALLAPARSSSRSHSR